MNRHGAEPRGILSPLRKLSLNFLLLNKPIDTQRKLTYHIFISHHFKTHCFMPKVGREWGENYGGF